MPQSAPTAVYVSRFGGEIVYPQGPVPQKSATTSAQGDEPGEGVNLSKVLQGLSGGGVATGALHMYQLGNTTSQAEVSAFLVKNNFAPHAADSAAQSVLGIVKSQAGKSAFIGIAGGAAIFGLLGVVRPRWSQKRKLVWSVVVAAALALTFIILARLGIVR